LNKELEDIRDSFVYPGYVIAVAIEPVYFVQSKPNAALILCIHGVSLLIFKPKAI
jgi:hypothetical protein